MSIVGRKKQQRELRRRVASAVTFKPGDCEDRGTNCMQLSNECLERLLDKLTELELKCKDCHVCKKTMHFIGKGLYECWHCTLVEKETTDGNG